MVECTIASDITLDATRRVCFGVFSFGHVCGSRSTRPCPSSNSSRSLRPRPRLTVFFSFLLCPQHFLRSYATVLKASAGFYFSLFHYNHFSVPPSPGSTSSRTAHFVCSISTSTQLVSMANNARVSLPCFLFFFFSPLTHRHKATNSNPRWRSAQGKWRRERYQQTSSSNIGRHRRWGFPRRSAPQRPQGRSTTSCPR